MFTNIRSQKNPSHRPGFRTAAERMSENVANLKPLKKNSFVEKSVTLADGEIFKFNSFIAMKADNDVPVLKNDECYAGDMGSAQTTGKFILLSNFLYFKHKNYRSNLDFAGKEPTEEILDARIMEVINVIQSNLLHPFVQEIHLLVFEQEAVDFLKRIDFQNSKKLVIKLTSEPVTMKLEILYASKCLKNRIIAMSHQDNKFGAGWERFNPDILHQKKIMYALTRHSAFNSSCKGAKGSANCDPGYPYLGSHDTFIFDVRNGFTSDELKPMDTVTPNLSGMENVFIWMFKAKLGFNVLNPCPILNVHHHHCVPIRDKNRRRVNTGATTGWAGYTDKLE